MSDRKRISTKWPSSALSYDGKVHLNLNMDESTDEIRTEMTPMQAMDLGMQLIDRARHCLKSIVNG